MKTTQILKAILTGALAGAAIFFVPFPFTFFFAFFFIFLAFRFFGFRRRWGWNNGYRSGNYGMFSNPDYAHKWHNMSSEQRKAFIAKMEKELFAETNTSTQTK